MSVGFRLAIATDGFRGGSSGTSTAYYTGESVSIVTDTTSSIMAVDNPAVSILQDKPDNYLTVNSSELVIMGSNEGDFISLN